MSAPMKKHHTNHDTAQFHWQNNYYEVPIKVLKQYQIEKEYYTTEEVFADLLAENTPAALHLQGLRHKEGLTQKELANIIHVSQANISAMENSKRPIGKTIAKRLQKHFGFDYRLFL